MSERIDETVLTYAADVLVRDFMCVGRDEQVVITTDSAADRRGVQAVFNAASMQGAKTVILTVPQMPYQGLLADPYIPEPVAAACKNADVWFDMSFPYMAGSTMHAEAMKLGRARSLQLADLGGEGIERLFGYVDLDLLYGLQHELDALVSGAAGKQARVTNERGTDITFTIGPTVTKKLRHTNVPGTYTPPGSAVIYPELSSVRGTVVIDAAFHEYHTLLRWPIRIDVDGKITAVSGGGPERAIMERALKRAGGGEYGSIIHFSIGFHPAARLQGRSFIEDIRVLGNNAIGFGIPWWLPGGGENHPDGVVTMQSVWIDGEQIVADGRIVAPLDARRRSEELQASLQRGAGAKPAVRV
jgi:leucyl aminopeptidase (aminopeptidase T)